jgi:hypothetical protein
VSSVAHRRARPSEVRRRWRRCPVGPASEQAQISLHRAGDLHPGRHPPAVGGSCASFPSPDLPIQTGPEAGSCARTGGTRTTGDLPLIRRAGPGRYNVHSYHHYAVSGRAEPQCPREWLPPSGSAGRRTSRLTPTSSRKLPGRRKGPPLWRWHPPTKQLVASSWHDASLMLNLSNLSEAHLARSAVNSSRGPGQGFVPTESRLQAGSPSFSALTCNNRAQDRQVVPDLSPNRSMIEGDGVGPQGPPNLPDAACRGTDPALFFPDKDRAGRAALRKAFEHLSALTRDRAVPGLRALRLVARRRLGRAERRSADRPRTPHPTREMGGRPSWLTKSTIGAGVGCERRTPRRSPPLAESATSSSVPATAGT